MPQQQQQNSESIISREKFSGWKLIPVNQSLFYKKDIFHRAYLLEFCFVDMFAKDT